MGANASFSDHSKQAASQPPPPAMGGPLYQRPTNQGARYSQYLCTGDYDQVTPRDKKKKASKFATLRKKLIRVRRSSRSLDNSKVMRELTLGWSIHELSALVEEYEASAALKELASCADLARPHARTCQQDLSVLYDCKYCTDVDIVYQGVVFPVHRSILSVRCPFFRDLLAHYPDQNSQVPLSIRTPGVDTHTFSALLRYLYTGEINSGGPLDNRELLVQLSQEFGTPNPLEHDLRRLMESGVYSDAVLVFASDAHEHNSDSLLSVSSEARTLMRHELRCHRAVLAARSPFFRNLILRRGCNSEQACIVLDESVIPRRYARVLLQALYMDSVNLACIVRSSVSVCSLSEVQAMVAGKGHVSLTEEAMEIFQIAQFIDFPILSQGCEDIIVERLSAENLLCTLAWSEEAHGSAWVQHQALHFLREEFSSLSRSPLLYDLSRHYLLQAIKSDFLQAGELDVLSAVIKWGEHELIKRLEEREPNLLSHTAHSISRKGVKKRDLNDVELRDILTDLLPFVRTDHVLPPHHDLLCNAIRRGLVSKPPSHMIGGECSGQFSPASAWVRCGGKGMYTKPRLFLPYYEEAKALLEEQLAQVQENEVVRLRMIPSAIPDTLYMVSEYACRSSPHLCRSQPTLDPSPQHSSLDVITGTIPVPDDDTLRKMQQRESELCQSPLVHRAYSLACADRREVAHCVRVRVAREFGLPDSCADLLRASSCLSDSPCLRRYGPLRQPPAFHTAPAASSRSSCSTYSCSHSRSSSRHTPRPVHAHFVPGVSPSHTYSRSSEVSSWPRVPLAASSISLHQKDPSILSDMMPDIAMATAQLSLSDPTPAPTGDLQLDLGDGNAHARDGGGTLYI